MEWESRTHAAPPRMPSSSVASQYVEAIVDNELVKMYSGTGKEFTFLKMSPKSSFIKLKFMQ